MFRSHLDYFQKSPLEGRPNTKPGDHGTPNIHNHWFILFYHVWGPSWIEIHWNSIWLRALSHMTSHYSWGSVTPLYDFEGVLGWPFDTLFRALTISWSRLLARVWRGPKEVCSVDMDAWYEENQCSKVLTLGVTPHDLVLDWSESSINIWRFRCDCSHSVGPMRWTQGPWVPNLTKSLHQMKITYLDSHRYDNRIFVDM